MGSYKHGAYFSEQRTSLLPPVRVDVSMPVIVSTAPVHTLGEGSDMPINKPLLLFSAEEAKQLGTLPDGASTSDYPLLQAVEIYLSRYLMAPICVINVFDPKKHVDEKGNPDVSKVTASDIIGGISTYSNTRTGLELINEIYPRFNIVPGQILAPGFSDNPAVALVLGAKSTAISGHFSCTSIADIPNSVNTYTQAYEYIKDNNLNDKNLIVFLGSPVFNNKAEIGSIHWAGVTAQRDSENENIPYWSPSNKRLLANGIVHAGKELILDSNQASYLNGRGIVTGYSTGRGLVAWGNRTSAYPGVTDVKDTMIPIRRMFNFIGNTLVSTAVQLVDGPLTRRLTSTVCDTVNVWLNGLTRRDYLLGGKVSFLYKDNPTSDIMDGISRFHVDITPPSPNENMNFTLEYDPSYVSTLFSI